MKNLDIIVALALMWGETLAQLYNPVTPEGTEQAEKLKGYESDEITKILTEWADEWLKEAETVTLDGFFDRKVELLP